MAGDIEKWLQTEGPLDKAPEKWRKIIYTAIRMYNGHNRINVSRYLSEQFKTISTPRLRRDFKRALKSMFYIMGKGHFYDNITKKERVQAAVRKHSHPEGLVAFISRRAQQLGSKRKLNQHHKNRS